MNLGVAYAVWCAEDLYVVWLFFRMPENILIQETGTAMTVYAPTDSIPEGRARAE